MVCCRCHITLKTARFTSFLLGHGIVDMITVILLGNVSTPPPRLSFQGLYIGFVLREAARCMLGEKVSSFLLTGRYFLSWNLSKTHPSYMPSELFFLKEPIDPKQAQNKSHGTHLGIELVLLCMDLVTTTPLSKSSLETCQEFALLSPEEQKESWHWANKAPSHQSRRKSPLVITGIFIKLRLSWKKFCFWYRVLPESHEAHRCQIFRVPRITLQLAQFFFLPITSKLEKSKAVAPSAQLCPLGYGRGGAAWLLITSLHGIQEERGEREGFGNGDCRLN